MLSMWKWCLWARTGLVLLLLGAAVAIPQPAAAESGPGGGRQDTASLWKGLVVEAGALGLPTRFLSQVPPTFVTIEFEDLRMFAAEYHPAEHRMVLNRVLSLNAAGRALRPLDRLPHKDLETLYHELFHAYMDFLEHRASAEGSAGFDLIGFAREQQQCRYQRVMITPVVQKKSSVEERFLSETESWEALNETWALFVGWAVWSQVEGQSMHSGAGRGRMSKKNLDSWLVRLKKAEAAAELTGYYEPESPQEKAMAHKRFLAPSFRISSPEVLVLLREVLGASTEQISGAEQALAGSSAISSAKGSCTTPPLP